MESSAGDPYRRPARRTQWLLSALAHHYGLDRGVENEIVVLATGLDQYLQEVFHHLDCRGAGRLPRADFRALCAVLGLNADGETATEDANSAEAASTNPAAGMIAGGDADVREEARLALRADPPELTFRQFHARLCGYFSSRAGPRLPRGALSEHIETQIRLRRPRRRRRPGSPSLHGGAYGERVAHLEEENSSLRELVEDLRAALQSSDARCLALQVGLWKSQSDIPEAAAHELQRAQGALAEAEARARRLQRGQVEVRLRTEEARQAVRRSLHRVRELEALARRVPCLQRQVQRLEAELRGYRSEGPQLLTPQQASPRPGNRNGEPTAGGTRDSDTTPEGVQRSDSRDTDEEDEQLFRSVEGQAASEEEEEERWQEKPGRPQAHGEVPLVQPSGCVSRCDDQTAETLKASFGHCDGAEHICTLELETHVTRLGEQLQTLGTPEEEAELQQMVEAEHLRLELQMVETERVRLSLLEEKLVDVLQLLQRLRDLNISKRALGKMLLNALDRNPSQEGTCGTLAILDTLHQALVGCELLQRNPSAPASTAPAHTNPFLISC
ncbi:EF-hand and coiled-coil domain-containing protein 1 isoform X2 [Mus musculus]|uniref:EF-hand and coiled-coil domain-containing protein 1 n=1 Tax=Mus musculus TaxID=10090 RepID=EFCC1_MOUSE|nr:EF-hand and coiled-coil domain-containing protein 1 [Mus musculus]XP_017177180.1 EF-hand and coiled-coil domain-containing protein 1 isoform X2 [Mus musculus]Q9JJF6.2 RecName: Full=EF-hand and coiled-coil domain-containing protein 1; AltName: Full=Coiled-coil domain-containing protein 48 [Mus musculus]|eukprot:NP_001153169.1 EF-hand and coiled-coil domain-containing protein 1 [Mus musculus]